MIHSDFNQIWTISDIPRGTEITIDCCAGRGFLSLRGKDSRKEYISRNILGEQFSCVCDFCQEPDEEEDQTIERLILEISKLQKERQFAYDSTSDKEERYHFFLFKICKRLYVLNRYRQLYKR